MERHEQWLLYLDESGTFEPGSQALVAGWLVRDFEAPEGTARLRRTLEHLFPLIPYPPHARDMKLVSARLAGAALLPSVPDEAREARGLREVCRAPLASLEEAPDALMGGFRRALAENAWPKYEALSAADAWLQLEHPAAYAALRRSVDDGAARISALLRTAADFYGPDDAFAIGAAGVVEDEEEPAAPGALVRDGYIEAVEATLERAIGILQALVPPERTVWMRILTRHVRIGRMGTTSLNHLHVAELAARAARSPLVLGEVKLRSIASVNEWGAAMHPACVIADFVSNRLFGVLGRASQWSALEGRASIRIGLPLEALARMAPERSPVPSLAATGGARRALQRAVEEGSPLEVLSPPWVASQAAAWLALASHLRGRSRP